VTRPSTVLCPSCGSLVGVNDAQCLSCGRLRPGMWGLTSLLRNVGDDMGFVGLVTWVCGALYLASLASDPEGIRSSGLLSFFSPSRRSLFVFGASGAEPVFLYRRWWSVLSAGWLHAGVLHILFNMLWVRDLAPATARLYGPGRTVILYVVAGVCGFAASTLAFMVPFLPPFLRGAGFTVGASAPIFGLIGALLYYGRRGGSSSIGQQAKSLAITMLLFGFVMPGIDNWAHLGGLAGGYLTGRILDPLQPEKGNHLLAAIVLLLLSLMAIIASVVTGLPMVR
jgi:membrane associated rhomboid family serine protease